MQYKVLHIEPLRPKIELFDQDGVRVQICDPSEWDMLNIWMSYGARDFSIGKARVFWKETRQERDTRNTFFFFSFFLW